MKRLSKTECVRKRCSGITMTRSRKKNQSSNRTLQRAYRKNMKYLGKKVIQMANDSEGFEKAKAELLKYQAMYGQIVLKQNVRLSKSTAKRDAFYKKKYCHNECDPNGKKPDTPQEAVDRLRKRKDSFSHKVADQITKFYIKK
jgi:hypothetical protein